MKAIQKKYISNFSGDSKPSSQTNFQISFSRLSNSNYQVNEKSQSQNKKITLIQINKEKLNNKNAQLLRLFKSSPPKKFNLQLLQKSSLKNTNQIFSYLVDCLNKQRQGIISCDTLQSEKNKNPTLIQNKIREFLFESLQQSLLMSEKQLSQTKFFERLFEWFTDVFKERQMKVQFKNENNSKNDPDSHDEDWIIRSTYKSNMPLQLAHYQRKMLNANQMIDFSEKVTTIQAQHTEQLSENQRNSIYGNQGQKALFPNPNKNKDFSQKIKLFSQTMTNSPQYQKSKQLLPLLNRKTLFSNLSKIKHDKENQEIQKFKLQWNKQKSHLYEHTGKNFYNKKYLKDKIFFNQEQVLNQSKKSQFKLTKKVLQKIHAAQLGVTLNDFRKNRQNKQSLDKLKNMSSHESSVFHPYLTSNYFNQIKKKKIKQNQKYHFLTTAKNKFNQSKHTEQSEQLDDAVLRDQDENQVIFFSDQNSSDSVINIDGLQLLNDSSEKAIKKKKK